MNNKISKKLQFLSFILSTGIIKYVLAGIIFYYIKLNEYKQNIILYSLNIISILLLLLIYRNKFIKELKEYSKSVKMILFSIFYLIFRSFIDHILFRIIKLYEMGFNEYIKKELFKTFPILCFINEVIIVSINIEMIYRFFLFKNIVGRTSLFKHLKNKEFYNFFKYVFFMFFSSAAFGLSHHVDDLNFTGFLTYFFIGLFFCICYDLSANLIFIIVISMINNASILVSILLYY